MLPALATKTRLSLARIAAWVGLIPIFATPFVVSPETSICVAVPELKENVGGWADAANEPLELSAKTAWKFAGFGGTVVVGITTGRYTWPQEMHNTVRTITTASRPERRKLIGTPKENFYFE